MVDLLDGRRSRATLTDFVKDKPLPFPPEPFRFAGIQATRWAMGREDKTGKRNLWLQHPRPHGSRVRQLSWLYGTTTARADQGAFVHPPVGLGAVGQ